MPYTDEDQKREYQRELMRKRRAEAKLNKVRDHSQAKPRKTRGAPVSAGVAEVTQTVTRVASELDDESGGQLKAAKLKIVARMLELAQQVLDGLCPGDLNLADAITLVQRAGEVEQMTMSVQQNSQTQQLSWVAAILENPDAIGHATELLRLSGGGPPRKEPSGDDGGDDAAAGPVPRR